MTPGLDHIKDNFPLERWYGFKKHTLPDLRRRWRPHGHLHRGRLRKRQVPLVEQAGTEPGTWRTPGGRSDPGPIVPAPTPGPPRAAAALLSGSLAPARAPGAWPRAPANGEARRPKLRDGRYRLHRRGLRAPRLRNGRDRFIFERNLLSLLAAGDACQRDVALLLGREGGNGGAPAPCADWPTGG